MRVGHICCFSALDELNAKQKKDPKEILRVLAKAKRFSTFEIDNKLAGPITWLLGSSGWIKSTGGQFPWTTVEITEAGQKILEDIK